MPSPSLGVDMRRRDVLAFALAGGCFAGSRDVVAQDRLRRVALLVGAAQDRDGLAMVTEFRRSLRRLGWIEGRNLNVDVFWSDGNQAHVQSQADAIVTSAPDVVFAYSVRALSALSQRTKIIPIVFLATSDPVGLGFVRSLAQPGGNLTGFTLFDYAMVGKMLQALKQVAPDVMKYADQPPKRRFNRVRTSGQAPLLPGVSSSPTFVLIRRTLFLGGLAPKYQRPPLGRWRGPSV